MSFLSLLVCNIAIIHAIGPDEGSRSSWRQVHSEGEDESKESTVMKIKRLSLKKLKTWR